MNNESPVPAEFTAEDVLKDYQVSNSPIEVLLPDGRVLLFSPIPDTPARKKMERDIESRLQKIPGIEDKGHKTHFISKLPKLTRADMEVSMEIHLRSIKPKFSEATAFGLHQAPTVLAHIKERLNIHDKEMLSVFYLKQIEIAEGKTKTSGSTVGSSPVGEPSQVATQTD